jgi:vacuolar-type H+-ATPase subunit C/Vma6
VRRAVDLLNVRAALSLGPGSGLPAGAVFLPDGESLDLAVFREALEADDRRAARERLAAGLGGGVVRVLADATIAPSRLDRALLVFELDEERAAARRDPLGPGPVLAFLLRQRLEVRDLRGLLWARALGAPPDPERWT